MRGWPPRLLLLCLSLVVCLGLAELLVRVLPETLLGFRYEHGHFGRPREFRRDTTTNDLGFHDVRHGPPQGGVRRLLLLGDSYVQGYSVPVPQTVGQRLQSHLNAAADEPWEVVAVGRADWGQREQLDALHAHGARIEPALVLTLFLSLNDVENNSPLLQRRAKEQMASGDVQYRPGWARRSADEMPWLRWPGSALNRLISHRLALIRVRRGAHGPESIPLDYFVYAVETDEVWREAWEETERLVAGARDAARELGASYAVASASTPQGVLGPEAGLRQLIASYPAMGDLEWDLDLPDRRMEELCRRNGIPFLTLEPTFRTEKAKGRTLHWRYDGHWNADGNDLAGKLLAEFVLELPSRGPISPATAGSAPEDLTGSTQDIIPLSGPAVHTCI